MESTSYVLLRDGVFLPCGDRLDFDIRYVRIQSINRSIKHLPLTYHHFSKGTKLGLGRGTLGEHHLHTAKPPPRNNRVDSQLVPSLEDE